MDIKLIKQSEDVLFQLKVFSISSSCLSTVCLFYVIIETFDNMKETFYLRAFYLLKVLPKVVGKVLFSNTCQSCYCHHSMSLLL